MKNSTQPQSVWQLSVLALAWAVLTSASLADEPVTAAVQAGAKAAEKTAEKLKDYRTNHDEMSKIEVKAALEQIDAELAHLEKLADAALTAQQKAEATVHHDLLKERRNQLKKEFTRARYAAFKADLQAEVDKLSAWARETFTNKPAARSAVTTATDATESATRKIADYRAETTDVNKAEVKAALARLDADIAMLSVKIDALLDADRKAEMKRRLNTYKERRSELSHEFRRARYDALVADVKSEWNQMIR